MIRKPANARQCNIRSRKGKRGKGQAARNSRQPKAIRAERQGKVTESKAEFAGKESKAEIAGKAERAGQGEQEYCKGSRQQEQRAAEELFSQKKGRMLCRMLSAYRMLRCVGETSDESRTRNFEIWPFYRLFSHAPLAPVPLTQGGMLIHTSILMACACV